MTTGGYFKLHRSVFNSQFFADLKPFDKLSAWSYLLANAAFCDTVQTVGKYEVDVCKGEFAYRQSDLIFTFGWTADKMKNFIKELIENEMITVRYLRKKCSIMSITDYHLYQDSFDDENIKDYFL